MKTNTNDVYAHMKAMALLREKSRESNIAYLNAALKNDVKGMEDASVARSIALKNDIKN